MADNACEACQITRVESYESLAADVVGHLAWVSSVSKWHKLCKYSYLRDRINHMEYTHRSYTNNHEHSCYYLCTTFLCFQSAITCVRTLLQS